MTTSPLPPFEGHAPAWMASVRADSPTARQDLERAKHQRNDGVFEVREDTVVYHAGKGRLATFSLLLESVYYPDLSHDEAVAIAHSADDLSAARESFERGLPTVLPRQLPRARVGELVQRYRVLLPAPDATDSGFCVAVPPPEMSQQEQGAYRALSSVASVPDGDLPLSAEQAIFSQVRASVAEALAERPNLGITGVLTEDFGRTVSERLMASPEGALIREFLSTVATHARSQSSARLSSFLSSVIRVTYFDIMANDGDTFPMRGKVPEALMRRLHQGDTLLSTRQDSNRCQCTVMVLSAMHEGWDTVRHLARSVSRMLENDPDLRTQAPALLRVAARRISCGSTVTRGELHLLIEAMYLASAPRTGPDDGGHAIAPLDLSNFGFRDVESVSVAPEGWSLDGEDFARQVSQLGKGQSLFAVVQRRPDNPENETSGGFHQVAVARRGRRFVLSESGFMETSTTVYKSVEELANALENGPVGATSVRLLSKAAVPNSASGRSQAT